MKDNDTYKILVELELVLELVLLKRVSEMVGVAVGSPTDVVEASVLVDSLPGMPKIEVRSRPGMSLCDVQRKDVSP